MEEFWPPQNWKFHFFQAYLELIWSVGEDFIAILDFVVLIWAVLMQILKESNFHMLKYGDQRTSIPRKSEDIDNICWPIVGGSTEFLKDGLRC